MNAQLIHEVGALGKGFEVNQCECGVHLGNKVICKPNKKVATIAWLCSHSCTYSPLGSSNNDYFIEQPISMTELDNFTCGWLK